METLRSFFRYSAALPLMLLSTVAYGQYKSEPAGAPPSEVPSALTQMLQKSGAKISNNGTAYSEIWLRAEKPAAAKTEENQSLPIQPGTLLGVIRFDGKGQDRRGQGIKPGVYTLRYALIPVNGDHQGAAPQRDFVVMSPVAIDTDLNATPAFDKLMDMSRKASGTPHPAVLSLWKADADSQMGLSKQGETDWVLQTKLGDLPIALIVAGIAAG